MSRRALLIGVSHYAAEIGPLLSPLKDVTALHEVLADPELGGFEVETLSNPDRQRMEEAIYTFLHSMKRHDLALLYFSGHGIKDDLGKLYLAPTNARLEANDLVKPSAVATSWILQSMLDSRCAQQIVILDCCFSGAFGDMYMGKGGKIDLATQIGGVHLPVSPADRKVSAGRVTLSSSTAVDYSLEDKASECSLYTRFLIEGIKSGKADYDGDGRIEARELHEYVRDKLAGVRAGLSPKIYPWGEGYSLTVSRALAVPSAAAAMDTDKAQGIPEPKKLLWRFVAGLLIVIFLCGAAWSVYWREETLKRDEAARVSHMEQQLAAQAAADRQAQMEAAKFLADKRNGGSGRPAMVIPVPSDCAVEFKANDVSAVNDADASGQNEATKITSLCTADFHLEKSMPSYLSGEAMACLDDVGLDMRRDSAMHLVLIGFGTFDEDQPGVTAAERAMTAKNYLVRDRGVDAGRIQMRVGPIGLRTVRVYGSDDAKVANRFSCVQSFNAKSLHPAYTDAGTPRP